MQAPTLVLLAAGLSKRFGRSKQETPVGPDREGGYYDQQQLGSARTAKSSTTTTSTTPSAPDSAAWPSSSDRTTRR